MKVRVVKRMWSERSKRGKSTGTNGRVMSTEQDLKDGRRWRRTRRRRKKKVKMKE